MPGCGDYAILAAMQQFMPELGCHASESCSCPASGAPPFPYYMQTYGCTRSGRRRRSRRASRRAADLSVWVVTEDGDALSIGATT